MKLNKELEILLNKQINMELAASYQYQAMAAYFDERALEGFSKWMSEQSKEEVEHSNKFYNYVLKRNGKIEFFALDKPKIDFTSVKEEEEEQVQKIIDKIVSLDVDNNSATLYLLDKEMGTRE